MISNLFTLFLFFASHVLRKAKRQKFKLKSLRKKTFHIKMIKSVKKNILYKQQQQQHTDNNIIVL